MSELEEKLNSVLSNPEAMGQIMQLARSLGGGRSAPPSPPPEDSPPPGQDALSGSGGNTGDPFSALGSLDPRLLNMAMKLMTAYQTNDDDRAALLSALRPFVREERYAHLDQAIRISKLTRVVRIALDSFRKDGGDGHV